MKMLSLKWILPRVIFLAVLVTGLVGLVYVSVQQTLRQGANDPQIELAENISDALQSGITPDKIFPPGAMVDIAHGMSVFAIVYDDNGKPLAGNGVLNGAPPVPPKGVLDFVRAHQEERVTWQPGLGIRLATVVRSYKTSTGSGFILVGRSLSEVEKRIGQLTMMLSAAWGALMVVIVIGVPVIGWMDKRSHQTI